MTDHKLTTPVAFIIFNRPDTTAQVLETIHQAQPPELFIIADGPRPDHPEDVDRCAAARDLVADIDWDCRVRRNYADTNMGCKRRVSSGLDWVFETVEEAIILEDDCLPHPTFFRFCQQLLARYREDERVMAISGDNFQFGRKRTEHSYYFSRYPHCWGWATWRRAWKHYDGEMYLWPTIKQNHWLHDILEDQRAVSYWTSILDDTYAGKINTWNYAWTFSCWTQSGLTILPNVNLVSNIGFGPQATHTRGTSQQAEMEVRPMAFPLLHPPCMIRDSEADHRTQRALQEQSRLTARIRRKALTTLRAVREALRM